MMEQVFYGMNLSDGSTFLTYLIKRAKSRINKKSRDTKRCIREIEINNAWETQVVQILRE